jgi:HEPN domain-containing protein
MRDLRQAKAMLAAAQNDLKALKGMTDIDVFAEEIFGFHVQQAIEKTLKAWLAALGKEYPLTHDISALLDLLRTDGQDVESYWDLVEYNAFAVRFRYEALEASDEPLDRRAAIVAAERLLLNMENLIAETLED